MPVLVPPREAYALWAATWDDDPSAIVALESAWMSRWLADVCGAVVVDAACGTGRWLSWLRERGAHAVGFDFSEAMLARGAAKTGVTGRLALAELAHLPVADQSADIVLCSLSLGHAPDLAGAMGELARAVKPGGRLLLSDFHPEAAKRGWKRTFRSGGYIFEVMHHSYTLAELKDAARQSGLELEELAEPGFDERQFEIFRRAGKEALFYEVRGLPAVLLAAWRRPCT
jgi:ubiquinone/menaquinone biosynthesis C-methylase UbiE